MVRPKKYQDLTITSLSTERKLLDEARQRKINLSELFTNALEAKLNFEMKEEAREDITEEEKQARKRLAEAKTKKKIAEMKFKGFPLHFLENVRRSLKAGIEPQIILNSFGGKIPKLTITDIENLQEITE